MGLVLTPPVDSVEVGIFQIRNAKKVLLAAIVGIASTAKWEDATRTRARKQYKVDLKVTQETTQETAQETAQEITQEVNQEQTHLALPNRLKVSTFT